MSCSTNTCKVLSLLSMTLAMVASKPRTAKLLRQGKMMEVPGGLDFDGAELDPELGQMCIMREDLVQTVERQPRLHCDVKTRKQCHTSYVTKFKPHQEEVCDEKFVKKCSIRFIPQYVNNTIRDCYKPWYKKCSNKGRLTNIISNIKKSEISTNQTQHCVTEYHSVCQTQPLYNNTDLMETKCKKIPRKLCGPGCGFIQGNETCREKVVTSVMDQPLEECDISPVKTCQLQTRLVPSLSPVDTCHLVPSHTCHNTWTSQLVSKPVLVRWCLDNTDEDYRDDSLEQEDNLDEDYRENNLEEENNFDVNDDLEEEDNPLLDVRLLFNNV